MPRGPVERDVWPKCVRCGERHKNPEPWHFRRRTYGQRTEADPTGLVCGTRFDAKAFGAELACNIKEETAG